MSKPAVIKINNQYKGDTYDGIQFTLLNSSDSLPIDLTSVSIKSQFRVNSKDGNLIKEITNGAGITIVDAINGVFKIDSFIIDWSPSVYYYDIEITFSNGVVKTYIQGSLKVIQDVTYG